MALYILDTTTVSLLQHGHPQTSAALVAHAGDTVTITALNVEETLGGWYQKLRAARTNAQKALAYDYLAKATVFLSRFPVLTPSEQALDGADRLGRLRLNVGRMDWTIAAVALTFGATVVTNNLRDFRRVPNLLVEDWSV